MLSRSSERNEESDKDDGTILDLEIFDYAHTILSHGNICVKWINLTSALRNVNAVSLFVAYLDGVVKISCA